MYSTWFWKVGVFLSVKSPKIFRKVCTKIIKTIADNTKRRRQRSRKKSKAVSISLRYRKTSQTQDVKNQSTKRSLRSLTQLKRDCAFEQKHVLFQIERPQEVLKTIFFVTTKEKSRAEHKQTFLERTLRRYGKFVFSFRWNRQKIFGRFVRKSSKHLHTIQNDVDHVSKNIKSCFYKYSISQNISNAGCKEPNYQP